MLLNNGKKILCRDTPDSILVFLSNFIEPLSTVSKPYSFDKELVGEFYKNVKDFYEKCTDKKEDGA